MGGVRNRPRGSIGCPPRHITHSFLNISSNNIGGLVTLQELFFFNRKQVFHFSNTNMKLRPLIIFAIEAWLFFYCDKIVEIHFYLFLFNHKAKLTLIAYIPKIKAIKLLSFDRRYIFRF